MSPAAAEADYFQDFPTSLLSIRRVADNGNVSMLDKNEVDVYKEEDVIISCKGKPIMIGNQDERGCYRMPLMKSTWLKAVLSRGQLRPKTDFRLVSKIGHN